MKLPRDRRSILIAAALVLLGVLVLIWVRSNRYPILVVNGESVNASRFMQNFRAAQYSYEHFREIYPASEVRNSDEIQAAILTQLVEYVLIRQEVSREITENLEALINERVERYQKDDELRVAAKEIYDMDFGTFTREVLVPEAERDILSGRMFLQDKNMDDWLREAKRSARVTVFSDRFQWNGESVISK